MPGGARALAAVTGWGHRAAPDLFPHLRAGLDLPAAARARSRPRGEGPPVVAFPSCLTRVFGPEEAGAPGAVDVLAAAGFAVREPPGMAGLCCGMPFASKGFPEAARRAGERALSALWRASDEGRVSVVTDASPCAGTLQEHARRDASRPLRILDFPAFWAAEGLAWRPPSRKKALAVVHPTCTLVKNGGLSDLLTVARACADEVLVPAAAECCGFAGDRGFLVPELTEAATRREAAEVRELLAGRDASLYSTCRTCEIGMTRAVGRPYRSLVELVAETLG
jgi:D-lactate dehydrogenase